MTTTHQLTFNVSTPGNLRDAGFTARSVIDEHCIVDHISFRSFPGILGMVIIHFTAASDVEAEKIADDAVKAASYRGSIDAVNIKHTTTKRKSR